MIPPVGWLIPGGVADTPGRVADTPGRVADTPGGVTNGPELVLGPAAGDMGSNGPPVLTTGSPPRAPLGGIVPKPMEYRKNAHK